MTIDELARRTRDDGAQHPRAPVARAAAAAGGPGADRLLRRRARGADRADPRAAGRRLQPRGDPAAARGRAAGRAARCSASRGRCGRRSRTRSRRSSTPTSWRSAGAAADAGALEASGEARHDAAAGRRPVRGAEPAPAAGRGRAGGAWDPGARRRWRSARRCADRRAASRALRRALPGEGVEAVRSARARPEEELAEGARGAGAAAPAGLRGAAWRSSSWR